MKALKNIILILSGLLVFLLCSPTFALDEHIENFTQESVQALNRILDEIDSDLQGAKARLSVNETELDNLELVNTGYQTLSFSNPDITISGPFGNSIDISAIDTDTDTTYSAGTGLTLTVTTFSVNTSQNITTLSNLTDNGFVKTSGGAGTLSVDTATYVNADGTTDLSGDWTISTNSVTLTAGTLTASTITDGTATLTGGVLNGLTDINATATDNVTFFGTNDVANDEDSKSVYFYRKAAEGNNYYEFYIDQYQTAMLRANASKFWISNTKSGCNITISDDFNIGATTDVGNNCWFRHHGYLTDITATKYVQWQVNDTTDNFELTREDDNIDAFDIQMPLITDNINIGSSVDIDSVKDENDMASDSATALATQQSIKAYVASQVTNYNLDGGAADTNYGGTTAIDGGAA